MASCDFFTNCVGVEPRIYTKYVKRRPMRQIARTVRATKSKGLFEQEGVNVDNLQKFRTSELEAPATSLFDKHNDLVLDTQGSNNEPGSKHQKASKYAKTPNFGAIQEETIDEAATEDEDVRDSAVTAADSEPSGSVGCYTWFSLAIVFCIQLGNQWQRFTMGYAFGYDGVGDKFNNPIYELRTAIPEMETYYGLLSGVIFLLPFSIFGLFTGRLVDVVSSRIILFGLVSILWSMTTLVQALKPNIFLFMAMRFLLGVFESTGNPLMYSLLRDYFPADQRATATSIVGSTISLGAAVSSLSILMIDSFGWRINYYVTAGYGAFIGFVAILLLREPKRGQFDAKKPDDFLEQLANQDEDTNTVRNSERVAQTSFFRQLYDSFIDILKRPCARWILIAGFFRFFGGYAFIYFNPQFFQKRYPDHVTDFSTINAALSASLSFISTMTGGIVSDKVRKEDPMTKAYVCMFAGYAGAPFLALAYLWQGNFWFSMAMVGCNYLVAEGWSSPTFAMLLDTTDPETQGLTVNVYFLFCMSAAMISTAVLDALNIAYDAENDPKQYGYILCVFMMISYIGSATAFFIAGLNYKNFMNGKTNQRGEKN